MAAVAQEMKYCKMGNRAVRNGHAGGAGVKWQPVQPRQGGKGNHSAPRQALYGEDPVSHCGGGGDLKAVPSVFMGGGSIIVKRHVTPQDGLCQGIFLTDVHANAAGYERIVGQKNQFIVSAILNSIDFLFWLRYTYQSEIRNDLPPGRKAKAFAIHR